MIRFLKCFLIIISLYFLLHTIIVFGTLDGQHKELVSGIKEIVRLGFVMYIGLTNLKTTGNYLNTTRYMRLGLVGMMIAGVGVTLYAHGSNMTSFKDMVIGLKYGWYFMFIFWSAGLVGFHITGKKLIGITEARIEFVVRLSWAVLLGGLLIQGSKILFPELRHYLGFGPLDIYRANNAPPLYYLTKQGGVMRYSGFFSGPNNLAFWLIGISPLLWYTAKEFKNKVRTYGARIALGLFGIINLGRVILIGRLMQIIPSFAKNNRIKNNRFIVGICIGAIIALFSYISYLKRESTTQHFALGLDALHKFFVNPRGYGLGSSGPGVHWHGSLLPENYYLQLALDYGFWGPIGFAYFWFATYQLSKDQANHKEKLDSEQHKQTQVLKEYNLLFAMGFLGMLAAGLFLHVFEDSMVNYLFFVSRGIVFGIYMQTKNHYLPVQNHKKNP